MYILNLYIAKLGIVRVYYIHIATNFDTLESVITQIFRICRIETAYRNSNIQELKSSKKTFLSYQRKILRKEKKWKVYTIYINFISDMTDFSKNIFL